MAKETRERRKRLGLCVECGKVKADEGYVTCSTCRAEIRNSVNNELDFCRKNKICYRCKKKRVYFNDKTCFECAEKIREEKIRMRERRKASGRISYSIERSLKLAEKNLCCACGKNEPESGKKLCTNCLIKKRRYNKINYMRKTQGTIPRSERASYGLCVICGKPSMEGKKVCTTCNKTLEVNRNKSRNSRDKNSGKEIAKDVV